MSVPAELWAGHAPFAQPWLQLIRSPWNTRSYGITPYPMEQKCSTPPKFRLKFISVRDRPLKMVFSEYSYCYQWYHFTWLSMAWGGLAQMGIRDLLTRERECCGLEPEAGDFVSHNHISAWGLGSLTLCAVLVPPPWRWDDPSSGWGNATEQRGQGQVCSVWDPMGTNAKGLFAGVSGD